MPNSPVSNVEGVTKLINESIQILDDIVLEFTNIDSSRVWEGLRRDRPLIDLGSTSSILLFKKGYMQRLEHISRRFSKRFDKDSDILKNFAANFRLSELLSSIMKMEANSLHMNSDKRREASDDVIDIIQTSQEQLDIMISRFTKNFIGGKLRSFLIEFSKTADQSDTEFVLKVVEFLDTVTEILRKLAEAQVNIVVQVSTGIKRTTLKEEPDIRYVQQRYVAMPI
ncbi:hypothetical protein [Proteus mirabilis]|uniref:hypothetical protein n=1 Tax=Proteus mirabilis TaxID=584 RepID=UPI0034D664D1